MEDLYIEPTDNTPMVRLNYKEGSIAFSGMMIPYEGYTFSKPILDWVKEYEENPQPLTNVKLFLHAANTSAAKALMMVFKSLEQVFKKENTVIIKWYYKDEEDLEDWMTIREFFELNFEFIKLGKGENPPI